MNPGPDDHRTAPSSLPVDERHPKGRGWTITGDQQKAETHIRPVLDLTLHDASPDCVCGPTVEIIQKPGFRDLHQYTHHSLDGRELIE